MKPRTLLIAAGGAAFVLWARGKWLAYNGTLMTFQWTGPAWLRFVAPDATN